MIRFIEFYVIRDFWETYILLILWDGWFDLMVVDFYLFGINGMRLLVFARCYVLFLLFLFFIVDSF